MIAADEAGFSLVGLLVAMVLLMIGIMGLAEGFVVAGRLTSATERQALMSHVGRAELERLQTLSYSELALSDHPPASTSPTNPDHYVSFQSPSYYFQPDPHAPALEPLVIDPAGVSPTPKTWSAGKEAGLIYVFVTSHSDGGCGVGCPASADYKRILVEVTQSGPGAPRNPLIIQTLVADPNAAPAGYVANGVQNPLQAAGTQCQTGGVAGPCQVGIDQGTANSFFLSDTPASQSYAGAPTTGNPLHDTTAIVGGLLCDVLVAVGCPVPDGMSPTLPSGATTAVNFSTDLGGPGGSTAGGGASYAGGRLLTTSTGTCSTPPPPSDSASNARAETWVGAPIAASEKLNGNGGMTLFMQSANGLTASVTVCVAIWVYPQSILNLIATPPVLINAFAYAVASLPAVPTPISFGFDLGGLTTLQVDQRIGVEVWLAAASSANAAIQYDNPAFASQVQLNTAP